MCNHCGTELKKQGYCVKCGKEICNDCASNNNPKVHAKCESNFPTPEPAPRPIPHPKAIPRPLGFPPKGF